jgi:acetyl esterase
MRVSARNPAKFLAAGLGAAVVLGVLAGCATTNSPTSNIAPMRDQIAANLHAYAGVTVFPDITYETVGKTQLQLDICLPPAPRGSHPAPRAAIIEVHGGSWAYDDKADPDWRDVCEWLASAGYVVANVDYRLAPQHPYPDAITDVEHAVEWLRKPAQTARYAIDPTVIGAFGGSAGGNLVSLLGTEGSGPLTTGHRVAAVAEMSGPINLTSTGVEHPNFYRHVLAYLGCKSYSSCPDAAAASPDTHVDPSDPPFFITHSTNELIPLSQSSEFVEQLGAAGIDVTFVTKPGSQHSIAALNYPTRVRIVQFFKANLVIDPLTTQ